MQIKKNPKADLTKNSNLYFAIGLAVILFISWRAIEWKTYDKSGYGYESLNIEDDDDEEVPITEQIKTPPPPPPPLPSPLPRPSGADGALLRRLAHPRAAAPPHARVRLPRSQA